MYNDSCVLASEAEAEVHLAQPGVVANQLLPTNMLATSHRSVANQLQRWISSKQTTGAREAKVWWPNIPRRGVLPVVSYRRTHLGIRVDTFWRCWGQRKGGMYK